MSKQVSNNPRKFLPALRTTSKDYISLMALAIRIVNYMTANIAIYATPNPVLADVTTQKDALKTAVGAGGSKWNRASKSSLLLIQSEAELLRSMIIALIAYAVNTVTTDDSQQTQAMYNFLLSGISVKKRPTVSGKNLNVIRGFRMIRSGTNLTDLTFRWKRPKGLIKGKPANLYRIEAYAPLSLVWMPVTETTKTEYIFNNGSGQLALNEIQFRVIPMNKNGDGQPYAFKLLPNPSGNVAPPFVTSDDILVGGIATPELMIFYPYTHITLAAEDSELTFYLSTSDGADIVPGQSTIVIASGASQTMTVEQFRTLLDYSPTNRFFNIKNTGVATGTYTVTLFVG